MRAELFLLLFVIQSGICTNFAFEKLAFMNGDPPTAKPEVVVDNDVGTCQDMTGGVQSYFYVDLKEFVRVEKFEIMSAPTPGVRIYADVLQYDPFLTPRSSCNCKADIPLEVSTIFDCDTNCSGRYINIRTMTNQLFSLCDVQVFGSINDSQRLESVYQLRSPFTIRMPAEELPVSAVRECADECSNRKYCIGFNYKSTGASVNCGLVKRTQGIAMSFRPEDWVYYALVNDTYCE